MSDPAPTPRELTALLAPRHPGVEVSHVEAVAVHRAGDGVASTADRVVLDVRYRDLGDVAPPSRLLLKTVIDRPRAPIEMYATEVRFYDELRDELAIGAPRSHGGRVVDEAQGRFALVLEDLSLSGARFVSVVDPPTISEVEHLLGQLAGLHAAFWASGRFERDLAWVATPLAGGMHDTFAAHGLAIVRDQVERHPLKATVLERHERSLTELWELLWVAQGAMAAQQPTLLHGDAHVGNAYVTPEGGGFVDWQLLLRGCWAHDVTYLLTTALDPPTRRAEERRLLTSYLTRLRGAGVSDVPDVDEARRLCAIAGLWGLLIGWCITPPENYGWEITRENLERVSSAVADHDTVAVLEELA